MSSGDRMFRILRFTALAVVLLAHGGVVSEALAQTTTDPVQTDSTISVGDDAISDAAIRARINGLLGQIESFQDVSVFVAGGVVTFRGQVLDNAVRDDLTAIADRVAGVVAIENRTEISASLEERLEPAVDRLLERGRNLLANGPIFFVAVSVFLVISAIGWIVTTRIAVWHWLAPNSFIADVYRAVARVLFVVFGVVIALDILNATALLGAVLGAAGVVGLALGFAVRDTVENFIASVLLSLRQPFRPNDFVEIDGDMGSVARLTSRATILISPDGNQIRIPNATVFKGRIVNYTRDPNRRFVFDLGVDADADLAGALAIAVSAIEVLPFILEDPPVSAWIEKVGDSNVVLTFAAWVNQGETDFMKARGEAIRTAKTALETAGFGLPEPIYRVRIDDLAAGTGPGRGKAGPITPKSPVETATELPSAANPEQIDDATDAAVARERRAADTSDDLLGDGKQAE